MTTPNAFGERVAYINDVLDWLAEWGREARRRQTGLLLLTAHRAKGLEFDDVVVLNGNWDRRSDGEDRDSARRLFYVAMTRARRSLALMQTKPSHPILRGVRGTSVIVNRRLMDGLEIDGCRRVYKRLNLSEVDLSFAGRLRPGDPSLGAIWKLQVGDPVKLEKAGESLVLMNSNGVRVGRLAKSFRVPKGAECVGGEVFAVVLRRKEESSEEFQSQLRRDRWEVIVPELTFT